MKDEERKKKVRMLTARHQWQSYEFQLQTLNRRFRAENVREAIELVGPVAAENYLATRGHCPEA